MDSEKWRILIVDDEPNNLQLMKKCCVIATNWPLRTMASAHWTRSEKYSLISFCLMS